MAKTKAIKERQNRLLKLVRKWAKDNDKSPAEAMRILSKELGYKNEDMLHTYAYSNQTISARALELLEFKLGEQK